MSATIGSMPNKPKTPLRNIRIDDALWRAALETATVRGESVSQVVRAALEQYVKKNRSK